MKPYTIVYRGWESEKEEFGDDMVFFTARIIADDSSFSFPLFLPFRQVIESAKAAQPAIDTILANAKKHKKGWGPHESHLVNELETCGIDLEKIVIEAIKINYNLEKEIARALEIPKTPSPYEAITGDMQSMIPEMKAETINYYDLCERLEKVISDEVTSRYPVIINSAPECITNLEKILIRHIPELANDLRQLIIDAESME